MIGKYNKLLKKKLNNQKAVLITAYDYISAKLVDNFVDAVLVGDSAAMVMLGYKSTIEISLEEIIILSKAVRRGLKHSYMIVDMPFMSYQPSVDTAIANCGKVIKETLCDAVKMEGDITQLKIIKGVIDAGIPVCGHIGMMPQKHKIYNGYPIVGKKINEAKNIIESAFALEEIGINMLIIENVPSEITEYLSKKLKIPVYSIGSGINSDGQIIVYHDILGLFEDFVPRFVKQYANISSNIKQAISEYAEDVKNKNFPEKDKIPYLDKETIKQLKKLFPDF